MLVSCAAKRNYCKLSSLNNRNLVPHSSGVWESGSRCWQGKLLLRIAMANLIYAIPELLVVAGHLRCSSSSRSFTQCLLLPSHVVPVCLMLVSKFSLFYKDYFINHTGLVSILMISSLLITYAMTQFLKKVLEFCIQPTNEFWWIKFNP